MCIVWGMGLVAEEPTTPSWQKELISVAYMQAICSVAGFSLTRREIDINSIDVQVEGRLTGAVYASQQLDLQLKCTASPRRAGGNIVQRLDMRAARHLSAKASVPRILAVLVVPCELAHNWFVCEPASVLWRCRMFWTTVSAPKGDGESVSVHLPPDRRLTPTELRSIMQRIADGGMP